jgi:hypothetical protein
MEHATLCWSFGDPTGWTVACVLFLLWSGVVGVGFYSISYRLLNMGSLDQKERPNHRASVMLGVVIGLALFSALYFTSLSGFSQLDLHNDQLTFRYILPERTTSLPFHEVINVTEEPTYKGRWRLILTTESNGTYESALAFRTEVQNAGDFLRQQMVQPYSLQR